MEPSFKGGKSNGTLVQGREERWNLSSGEGRAMETLVQIREEQWNLSSGEGILS
jgi:hypothetical protein